VPNRRRNIRSTVLFVFGLAGFAHETLMAHGERPTLLVVFAAMAGLPKILSIDEQRREVEHPPEAPPTVEKEPPS
jgi:hypothetical protein